MGPNERPTTSGADFEDAIDSLFDGRYDNNDRDDDDAERPSNDDE